MGSWGLGRVCFYFVLFCCGFKIRESIANCRWLGINGVVGREQRLQREKQLQSKVLSR